MRCPKCGNENPADARFCSSCGAVLSSSQSSESTAEAPDTSPEVDREEHLHYCHFHPNVETGVACNKCGRYICPRDMVQTPVGIRCKECAQIRKMPTFDVTPTYYLRAGLTGGAVGIVAGIIWGLVLSLWAGIPFLPWIIALGVGYIIGETISQATNRKRGPGLAIIAGVSVVLAAIASGFIIPSVLILFDIFFRLLILAVAIYVAVSRVR